jgi:hypothetical protein
MESSVSLSPSEAAYFESGGETQIVDAPANDAAPHPDPAPIVDPAAAVDPQPQPRDENGKFIPHSVFHAEREEHKKTKAALEEINRKQAVLEDRWNTILKLKEQPAAAEEPAGPPDPNEDIFAFSKWQADKIKALEEKVTGREKQEEQARTVEQQEREIWSHWSESAKSYAAEKTDFGDAVTFLSDARTKQLAALAAVNPDFATEQGRLQQINAELRQIVAGAKQLGRNPAEIVYEMASAYGYAPKAPSDPGKVALPDKLAAIDAAQNASRTLATPGGRNAAEPMTAETIASMSATEFDAWYKSPDNQRLFAKMMGG